MAGDCESRSNEPPGGKRQPLFSGYVGGGASCQHAESSITRAAPSQLADTLYAERRRQLMTRIHASGLMFFL